MNNLFFAFAQVNTENTKRVLYTVFLIIIILIAILSLIGSIILRVIDYQGKLLDREISDPIRKCRLIKDQKHFTKYAVKKNNLLFFKQSLIPIAIILVGVIILILYYVISENWSYNPWDMEKGFGSLLITWDFKTIIKINPDGNAGVLVNWPEVSHSPHFDINNWCGYVTCTLWIIGGLWYLYSVQGLMGRTFRILKLRKTIYDKSLENFNLESESQNLENFKQ